MGAHAPLDLDRAPHAQLAPQRRPDEWPAGPGDLHLITALQRSVGNAAVTRLITHDSANPIMLKTVQRCGPTPCNCSDEERAERASRTPAAALQRELTSSPPATIQRWPFSNEQDEGPGDPDEGVLGRVGDQASAVVDTVTEVAGAAYDNATEAGTAAVEAVSSVAGEAYDRAEAIGSAAVGSIVDAASSTYDSGGAAVRNLVLEQKRAAAIAQLDNAREQLRGLDAVLVSDGQLLELNDRLASLRTTSSGQIAIPGLGGEGGQDSEHAIAPETIDGLLGAMRSWLSDLEPSSGDAAQRNVQRYAEKEIVDGAIELGKVVGGGGLALAPETGGSSIPVALIVIAIIVVIVLLILAYIALSKKAEGDTKPVPTPKPDPKGEGETGPTAPRKKKERKRCPSGPDCREATKEPCPEPLPVGWPRELPFPDTNFLIRVKDEDVEFPKERRGGAQARLRAEIDEARRRLLPPPRPCDPDRDLDPNAPRDAHHRLPLALGGRDSDENLCALEADDHQKGHVRLNDQSKFFDQYERECCYCTARINDHPPGQEYFIQGTK